MQSPVSVIRNTRALRLARLMLATAGGILTAWEASASSARSAERAVAAMYQPFRVEYAALSPDGSQVAFLVRESRGLEVQLFSVDRSGAKRRVPLGGRADAGPTFLGWADSNRVVAASDLPSLVAIDAGPAMARPLLDARTFARGTGRPPDFRVLGFPSDDSGSVILEETTRMGRDIQLDIVRLNLERGERQRVGGAELDHPGGAIHVDQQGRPRLLWARDTLPQRFSHRPVSGGRWQPLDAIGDDAAALAFHVTPANYFGPRSIPLGFAGDPAILYFSSNVGRDTFGVYAFDLRTGRRTDFSVEDAECDLVEPDHPWTRSPLVFDRARRTLVGIGRSGLEARTHWLDREIGEVQASLEKKFPGRNVQLLGWDDERRRFLVLVASNADPGRYFVHHRADGRCVEYLRRGAGLEPEMLNRSESFAFHAVDGGRITGYLTLPRAASLARPPLLVWLHDGPGQRLAPGFNREAQALAARGFIVLQINYRGSAGFGRAARESIRTEPDAGPLADVLAAVAWVVGRRPIDRRRVALVGEGFGGYLALRALQQQPDAFRCAIAINAPVELADLRRSLPNERRNRAELEREMLARVVNPGIVADPEVRAEQASQRAMSRAMAPPEPIDFEHELLRHHYGAARELDRRSVLREAARITKPVMLLHDPSQRYAPIEAVRQLRDVLERRKQPVAFGEISPLYARGALPVRAQVVRRVGDFLNVTLYDFDVKIGEAKEVR